MYAKASTPSPSNSCLKKFSTDHIARQNIAGSMLEEETPRGPSTVKRGLVLYHNLAANGVSAGTQLVTSASTTVLCTMAMGLDQSLVTIQLLVSCSVRALTFTCSTLPGTATPHCLTSRLTSNSGRHCRMAPVVMSLLHVMPAPTGRHVSPNALRLNTKEELSDLWQERVRLADESPPKGGHAPAGLVSPDVGSL